MSSASRPDLALSLARITLAATVATLFVTGIVSAANTEPSLSQVTVPTANDFVDGRYNCTASQIGVVNERRQRIADAESLEEARDLALSPARAAKHALQVASLVAPSAGSLTEARERIEGFEVAVGESESPSAVAGEFGRLLDLEMQNGSLLQVADLNVKHAEVRGPGACHYTTGEIIAVVFGFILFIIPGIVLLFVLC